MSSGPLVYHTNPFYLPRILRYHGLVYTQADNGALYIDGYPDYNHLTQLQSLMLDYPSANVIDRTGGIKGPINFHVPRPWTPPVANVVDLEQCMANTVSDLQRCHDTINILWSGGIDSTAMLIGFIKHATDPCSIRVLYTASSIRENSVFYLWLTQHCPFEMVEFDGLMQAKKQLGGVYVTGDGADDLTAYLDEALLESVGLLGLKQHWLPFLRARCDDKKFLDFCCHYFSKAGRPIESVLEARWWFFTNSNIGETIAWNSDILGQYGALVVGFYDNEIFEHFMFYNIDAIIAQDTFTAYKGFLKQYIYNFNHDSDYRDNKRKVSESQLAKFGRQMASMRNHHYCLLLADGTRIRTPNMPLLSEVEYRRTYGHSLDYLFNA